MNGPDRKHCWHRVINHLSAPRDAGCYAIYSDGKLLYLGCALNLKERLATIHWQMSHGVLGLVRRTGTFPNVLIKLRLSGRAGDQFRIEQCLIHRLRPPGNTR